MASPTGREEATLIIDLNFLTCEFYFYASSFKIGGDFRTEQVASIGK